MEIEIETYDELEFLAVGLSADNYKDLETLHTFRLVFRTRFEEVYSYLGLNFKGLTLDQINQTMKQMISIIDHRLDMNYNFTQQERERALKRAKRKETKE